MHKRQNILVSMPTGSHSERMKLEGVLQYAHEKSGATWDLELGVIRIDGRRLAYDWYVVDKDGSYGLYDKLRVRKD